MMKMLKIWNDTAHDYPRDRMIHQWFEEQVEKTPNDPAVVYEDSQLTYQELNQKSNQLAHYLRTQGVGPEIIVALACERSLEMIIGIMGILKAGGAFVPMDPASPHERLVYLLEDTKTPIVLTQSWLTAKLPITGEKIIELDKIDKITQDYPLDNLKALSGPNNLVYVIYTSGSTGKPKGVMIENKNLMHFISWFKSIIPVSEKKGSLIHSPIVFDMPIPTLFYPLITGNYIHIISQDHDPEALIEALKKNDTYSFIKLTPSHLKLLENRCDITTLENRTNCLIIAGEELKYEAISKWLKLNPKILFFNEYGPTETTVGCTIYHITEKDHGRKTIPIGKPVWNTSLYILDETLHHLPIGVMGELYVGGDGIARGYLNRPDLTAEKFIPNPFMTKEDRANNRNQRLYRTGDLCRYLEDGNIEYGGRIDHQVKIRGFRIELGEIESTLLTHSAVQDTVVVAKEDEDGSKQLVAYYVVTPGASVEPAILREHLKSTLPTHMIPTFFVPLQVLPLSPSGKVDRIALPVPKRGEIRQDYLAPRTSTEKELVEIWQEILRIDHIGVTDNFFELGGDSLKSTSVMARIKKQNNLEIPYRYFFENPTIEKLSQYINNNMGAKIKPLVKVSRDQDIPIAFSQLPLLLEEIYVSNLVYVAHLDGPVDLSALEESLNQIIERHEALRSSLILQKKKKNLPLQNIEAKVSIKINQIDLTDYSEEEKKVKIEKFIDHEIKKYFDLRTAPLYQFHLIKKNKAEHLFVFVIHHIFFDLDSVGILFNELSKLYNAKILGNHPELPNLPIQWADYSHQQWEYLKGQKSQEHLSYWRDNLKNPPKELQLPIDFPRRIGNMQDVITGLKRLELILKYSKYFLMQETIRRKILMKHFKGARHSFVIPKEISRGLKKICEEQNVTLYMTLLTAFNVLIYGYNSQDDILIGSPFSNRNRIETEELIGYFVNFIPIRTNLKGNPTFNQLLKRVKDVTLRAYDYQNVPWIDLFEQFKEQEDTILLNIGRLMFNFHKNLFNNLSLKGIVSNKEPYDSPYCECELILTIEENGNDLSGHFKYRTNLFKPETIEHMSKKFITLLESIIANPKLPIDDLISNTSENIKKVSGNAIPEEDCYDLPLDSNSRGTGMEASLTGQV